MPHVVVIEDEENTVIIEVPRLRRSSSRGLEFLDEESDRPHHEEKGEQAVHDGDLPDPF